MKVTLCDWRTGKEPCGERASVEVHLRWDDKNWTLDICDRHSKELTANAREESQPALPQGYTSKVTLPRATGRSTTPQLVDKADYPDLRAWAEFTNRLKPASRGRIKEEVQQAWLEANSPRQVADGSFKPST